MKTIEILLKTCRVEFSLMSENSSQIQIKIFKQDGLHQKEVEKYLRDEGFLDQENLQLIGAALTSAGGKYPI